MNWKDIAGILGRDEATEGPMSQEEGTIYEEVALGVSSRNMRSGVYAKAFKTADGDERRALAIYIEY